MAKFKRHNFGGILEALNKMIIAEVKAALELLPDKCIREDGCSLCRIIIGHDGGYSPRNIAVDEVWVDEKDGLLHIYGRDLTHEDCFDQNWADNVEPDEWTEEDDLYDISGFEYLIDQIEEQVDGDRVVDLPHRSLLTCGYYAELSCHRAVDQIIVKK